MTESDEDQRRERLRALQNMRGQVAGQQAAGAGASQGDKQPQGDNQRGAGLRALLQRRQAGNAGNAQQGGGGGRLLRAALAERGGGGGAGSGGNQGARGGGLLRAALENRARNNPAGAAGGSKLPQGATAGAEGKGAASGNRGQLIRRIMQARRRDAGGQPSQYAQQLSELHNRVHQLTEEVERLRANQAAQTTAASQTPADPGAKQPEERGSGTTEKAGQQAPTPGKTEL
jgi:uncharacterized small protein (DUF1192 family)